MGNGRVFFKALNALAGAACIYVGAFLPHIDAIHILQAPGEDAYRLIQAHWIATGVISLLVARSNQTSQFWVSLLMIWLFINGWLGGKALLATDVNFAWVLAFPVTAFLNFFQTLAQDKPVEAAPDAEISELHGAKEESPIPADFHELRATSPAGAMRGIFSIIVVVALQILLLVLFFFYGTLMTRIIFDGMSVDLSEIPEALGGAVLKTLYIPIIIAAVYSVVFLVQIALEKLALSSGASGPDDINRPLSIKEKWFIAAHLEKIGVYLSEAKYPWFYGWFFWPSLVVMIGSMIGIPYLVAIFEAEFFNALDFAGFSEQQVITHLGPAFVGGVLFSFLFGIALYWAALQWLGSRHQSFGEYLHSRWGWNSMSSEARPLAAYAKIFTRFVRRRRYEPERDVEPQQFLFDAYNEFSGLIYRSVVVFAVATVVFTALDVNWRRVAHVDGFHYSPYFDYRSFDLTLDDVVEIELRCFLYRENDDGERKPGAGYDVVYSNGMRGSLFDGEIDAELLTKVEAVDANLRARDIPTARAKHAGRFILRGIDGYWPDCAETVLSKFAPDIRDRMAALIRVEPAPKSPAQN